MGREKVEVRQGVAWLRGGLWGGGWAFVVAVALGACASVGGGADGAGETVEASCGGGGEVGVVRRSRPLMGTVWTIHAVVEGSEGEAEAAVEAALDEASRLEGLISEWRPDSDVGRVNAGAGGGAVAVSAETMELLRQSRVWSERTAGAFDVTWRPLGEVWRIEGSGRVALPESSVLEAARGRVGWRRLELDEGRSTARLPEAGMAVGVGAMGKGWAASRAAEALRARGLGRFVINAGGDVVASGCAPGGGPWKVAVTDPAREGYLGVVLARDVAVMTSGGYEKFIEIDGVRYSHIIDPRSGRPARGVPSVTIIAADGGAADALATAVFVLGVEAGLALVEELAGVEAILVAEDGKVRYSSGAEAMFEAVEGER